MANGTGVFGDREVVAALRQLADMPVAVIDQAAIDAFQPMLEETKEHYRAIRNFKGKTTFPQGRKGTRGGTHVDQLLTVRKTKSGKTKRQYWMGARGRAINLAHLVEFGTAPHYQPNMRIQHPGARPSPGMAPAFEAHGDDVIESMGKALWQRMSERAATLNRPTTRRR